MQIQSKLKTYNVIIEPNTEFIRDICTQDNTQFVIDYNFYNLYKHLFNMIPEERLMLIEAIEENKVIDTAMAICESMTSITAKRNASIISFGGGIIQDITGFAANVLYRGIKWIYIPTTLLASCDSCIGGKTSLNYKKYKNLLGTFYPPDEIHICTSFFHTLSEKDFKSGLGEVVKFNLMNGEAGYTNIVQNIDLLISRNEKAVSEFVISSLEFKKKFIEIDEFDKGERIKLNFAHTFGHAIETVTEYEVPHGTAVAIGMIIADRISANRGLLSYENQIKSEELLRKVIDVNYETVRKPVNSIIDAMKKDKKQTGAELTAILRTDKPNELRVVKDLSVSEIEDGFEYFYSK